MPSFWIKGKFNREHSVLCTLSQAVLILDQILGPMSYSAPAARVPLVEIVIPVKNEQRELADLRGIWRLRWGLSTGSLGGRRGAFLRGQLEQSTS
jgi:hypothetical protein